MRATRFIGAVVAIGAIKAIEARAIGPIRAMIALGPIATMEVSTDIAGAATIGTLKPQEPQK